MIFYISYFIYLLGRPHWATISYFGMPGDTSNVITCFKYSINEFVGFLEPPIFPFFTGLADRPYNSISTTVLH